MSRLVLATLLFCLLGHAVRISVKGGRASVYVNNTNYQAAKVIPSIPGCFSAVSRALTNPHEACLSTKWSGTLASEDTCVCDGIELTNIPQPVMDNSYIIRVGANALRQCNIERVSTSSVRGRALATQHLASKLQWSKENVDGTSVERLVQLDNFATLDGWWPSAAILACEYTPAGVLVASSSVSIMSNATTDANKEKDLSAYNTDAVITYSDVDNYGIITVKMAAWYAATAGNNMEKISTDIVSTICYGSTGDKSIRSPIVPRSECDVIRSGGVVERIETENSGSTPFPYAVRYYTEAWKVLVGTRSTGVRLTFVMTSDTGRKWPLIATLSLTRTSTSVPSIQIDTTVKTHTFVGTPIDSSDDNESSDATSDADVTPPIAASSEVITTAESSNVPTVSSSPLESSSEHSIPIVPAASSSVSPSTSSSVSPAASSSQQLVPTVPASSSEQIVPPAASSSVSPLVVVPSSSEQVVLPALSSEQLLPPAMSSEQIVAPADSSDQVIPYAMSSEQVVPPAVSSDQVLPPAMSSEQVVPPAASSDQVLPPAISSEQIVTPASSSDQILPPAMSSEQIVSPVSSSDQVVPFASSSEQVVLPTVSSEQVTQSSDPATSSEQVVLLASSSEQIVPPATTSSSVEIIPIVPASSSVAPPSPELSSSQESDKASASSLSVGTTTSDESSGMTGGSQPSSGFNFITNISKYLPDGLTWSKFFNYPVRKSHHRPEPAKKKLPMKDNAPVQQAIQPDVQELQAPIEADPRDLCISPTTSERTLKSIVIGVECGSKHGTCKRAMPIFQNGKCRPEASRYLKCSVSPTDGSICFQLPEVVASGGERWKSSGSVRTVASTKHHISTYVRVGWESNVSSNAADIPIYRTPGKMNSAERHYHGEDDHAYDFDWYEHGYDMWLGLGVAFLVLAIVVIAIWSCYDFAPFMDSPMWRHDSPLSSAPDQSAEIVTQLEEVNRRVGDLNRSLTSRTTPRETL